MTNARKPKPKPRKKVLRPSFPPRTGMEVAGFLYSDARRNAIASIEFIAERFQIHVEIHG